MSEDPQRSVRLFFALWPDAATVEQVGAAAAALTSSGSARPVPPGDYHVTLAFLGEVPRAELTAVRQVADALRHPCFDLRFDGYEYWPKPEVVVARAAVCPDTLASLWEELHEALQSRGWGMHPKRLRPHVTLTRKMIQPPVLPRLTPFDWHADAFSLVRSDTGGARSVYTVLQTWPLLDKHAKL